MQSTLAFVSLPQDQEENVGNGARSLPPFLVRAPLKNATSLFALPRLKKHSIRAEPKTE